MNANQLRAALIAVVAAALGGQVHAQARSPMAKVVEEAPPLAVAGPATTVVRFKPEALEWSQRAGRNTITGDAILRTRGGAIRTCAATEARLWPLSDYTLDFLGPLFLGASLSPPDRTARGLKGIEVGVYRYVRAATCNGQGVFTFSDLPDGQYFLTASVTWEVPRFGQGRSGADVQGGDLGKLVSVKGGQTLVVTLTE